MVRGENDQLEIVDGDPAIAAGLTRERKVSLMRAAIEHRDIDSNLGTSL